MTKKTNSKPKVTKSNTKQSKTTSKPKVEIVKEEVIDKELQDEEELIIDVSDVKPIVKLDKPQEEGLIDVNIEDLENKKKSKTDNDIDESNSESKNEIEKEYESLPKVTLNEIRVIKRKEKEKQEEQDKKINDMPTVDYTNKGLSKQAQQWKDWLDYYKMTPEQFIEKYPTHKFLSFIKEIIKNKS